MVFEARLGHPGGVLSVADILATLYLGVLKIDPEGAARARSGPADPEQGPCERRPLRGAGRSGLHPHRVASELHEADVDAERASEPELRPGRGSQYGTAWAWHADCCRRRSGGENRRSELSGLRHHRRRRIAGGQQLGGRHGGRTPQARQSDPHRRQEHAPAGRAGRRDQRRRAARRQVPRVSPGTSSTWTGTTHRRCSRRSRPAPIA